MNTSNLMDTADIPNTKLFPSDKFISEYRDMTEPELEVYHYKDLIYEKVMPHVHDHYEFYFFLGGNVRYTVGEHSYNMQPGDFLVVQPGQIHYPVIEPSEMHYVYERVIVWVSKAYYEHLMEVDASLHAIFDLIEETGTCHFRPGVEAYEQLNSLLRSAWYEARSEELGQPHRGAQTAVPDELGLHGRPVCAAHPVYS